MTVRKSGFLIGLFAVAAIGGAGTTLQAQPDGHVVAITDAMIFDATGRQPFQGSVVIRDGRIEAVGLDVKIPRGANVIRAEGRALLPGLFDVHTHWSSTGSPGTLPQIAAAYVQNGVTTVNDFHQQPEAFKPRRAWLAGLATPHVNFVARISTPGGHGADWADTNTTKWVATAESARREVAALQAYQPDFIKVFADGWRYGTLPEETSMNLETLSALVQEAHKHGQRVLTHTVTVERGKIAARAGVDVIAHSLQDEPIDDEAVSLLRGAKTFYAPTLAIFEPTPAKNQIVPDLSDSTTRQRYRKWGFAKRNLRTLYEAGVQIVLGTDAGIGGAAHGTSTLRELELMVDAGLPPAAALIAGTANSAKALGEYGDRGSIEPGKRADLLLVDGKPWQTISDIHRIRSVIVDGKVIVGPRVKLPEGNSRTSLPAVKVTPLIDDFERTDDRSSLDTLRLTSMDGGVQRSAVVASRVPRGEGFAFAVMAQMAQNNEPAGGILIPLQQGSVRPVDAREFAGIQLELRGGGRFVLIVNTLEGEWSASVDAPKDWTEVRIPFSDLKPSRAGQSNSMAWRGDDLLQVGLQARRKAGETAWAELDNVRFYLHPRDRIWRQKVSAWLWLKPAESNCTHRWALDRPAQSQPVRNLVYTSCAAGAAIAARHRFSFVGCDPLMGTSRRAASSSTSALSAHPPGASISGKGSRELIVCLSQGRADSGATADNGQISESSVGGRQ